MMMLLQDALGMGTPTPSQGAGLWLAHTLRIQSAGFVWWARDATDTHAPSCAAAPASSGSRHVHVLVLTSHEFTCT